MNLHVTVCLFYLAVQHKTNATINACSNNITHEKLSSWKGAVKGLIAFHLDRTVTDWTLEIQFDQSIIRFQQWLGKTYPQGTQAGNAAYFVKPFRGHDKKLRAGTVYMAYIANYVGTNEPEVKAAAVCGYFSSKPSKVTPKPDPNPPTNTSRETETCQEAVINSWPGGVQRRLYIPVVEDIKDWMMELRFDKKLHFLGQWSCENLVKDGGVFVCENQPDNGVQKKGRLFKFEYILQTTTSNKLLPRLTEVWFANYHCTK